MRSRTELRKSGNTSGTTGGECAWGCDHSTKAAHHRVLEVMSHRLGSFHRGAPRQHTPTVVNCVCRPSHQPSRGNFVSGPARYTSWCTRILIRKPHMNGCAFVYRDKRTCVFVVVKQLTSLSACQCAYIGIGVIP